VFKLLFKREKTKEMITEEEEMITKTIEMLKKVEIVTVTQVNL
jgi:hypothetical protein